MFRPGTGNFTCGFDFGPWNIRKGHCDRRKIDLEGGDDCTFSAPFTEVSPLTFRGIDQG
jgi:hypothetical protein